MMQPRQSFSAVLAVAWLAATCAGRAGATPFDAGIYRFHAIADDGVRLYVDGQVVIDEWGNNPGTEFSSETKLRAGQHAIKVEYYEYGYNAKIKVVGKAQMM